MRPRRFGVVLGLALLLLPGAAAAASPAGEIAQLTGRAVAEAVQADGGRRRISSGDSVFEGERILTGRGSSLEIRFSDDSRFHLGPNAELAIDKFVFRAAEEEAFHTRVLKGAFRLITGLVGKARPASVRVNIAVATIGLRGTDILGEVKPRQEKDGKTVDASAEVMLQQADEKDGPTSIVVANDFGSVVIDQPGFGTSIPDEKSPPSAVRRMQLRTVANVLRSIRSTLRQGNTARPRPR